MTGWEGIQFWPCMFRMLRERDIHNPEFTQTAPLCSAALYHAPVLTGRGHHG